jgi:hypothetical protein
MIRDAKDDALKRLDSAACKKAVGGKSKLDLKDALNAAKFDVSVTTGETAHTNDPYDGTIFLQRDEFFSSSPEQQFYFQRVRANPTPQLRQLASANLARSLVLLHELRHIAKNGNHPLGNRFPFDIEILKGCFGIDSTYPKGWGPNYVPPRN